MENPFKFGSIVDGEHFTNRVVEMEEIERLVSSKNHLIIISPRRFGKTSLIKQAVLKTPYNQIFVNMQAFNTIEEFASKVLSEIYKIFTVKKLRDYIKNFRLIPNINVNPITQEVTVNFGFQNQQQILIEDVFNLLDKLAKNKKIICIIDEFQDIFRIDKSLDRMLRTIMQEHKNVNYVFLGSEETMMRNIFEDVKSPFYHFGDLMTLNPISYSDFLNYITERFAKTNVEIFISQINQILNFTQMHPYYTQQLAFNVWNTIVINGNGKDLINSTINEVVQKHDYDFERLWSNFNNTDRIVLKGLLMYDEDHLSADFAYNTGLKSTSTIASSLKRLLQKSYLIRVEKNYRVEDPFFAKWIEKTMIG